MSSRGSTNTSINNSPNVKRTLLKGLISKPVAEAKKTNQKRGNESKFDSQTLSFPSQSRIFIVKNAHIPIQGMFPTVYKTLQWCCIRSVASGTTANRPNDNSKSKWIDPRSSWHPWSPEDTNNFLENTETKQIYCMWTICWTISFRHKDITETSEEHWGKNYINANIFFFKSWWEKSGIEHDCQISAFDTNTRTHTQYTLFQSQTHSKQSTKSKCYTSMWLNISYCCHI